MLSMNMMWHIYAEHQTSPIVFTSRDTAANVGQRRGQARKMPRSFANMLHGAQREYSS